MTIIIIVFLVFTFMGIPIGYVMGLSSLYGIFSLGGMRFIRILVTRMQSGLNDHVLIAIPFFIITSEIMNRAGITKKLIAFANGLLGHISGGLSHANILVSILFAGLTGTQVTDTVAIGKILIPSMKEEGYPGSFSSAVTAASSVLGPIIPPSIVMVIYSTLIRQTSVRALFVAGILPGLLMGISLLVISGISSYYNSYPKYDRVSFRKLMSLTKDSILALLTPIVILYPIFAGITTITEASALGSIYALFLGFIVYRSISIKDFWEAMIETVKFSGVIFLLIGTSHIIGWFVTRSGISRQLADLLSGFTGSDIILLLLLNIFLLLAGMFIDVIPAAIIFVPVLAPIFAHLGFDYLHIAIVMIVNLNLGGITPPVGMTIMTSTKIADVPYESSVKACIPFFMAHIFVLILITYFPNLTLWVPRLFGVWM